MAVSSRGGRERGDGQNTAFVSECVRQHGVRPCRGRGLVIIETARGWANVLEIEQLIFRESKLMKK